METKPPLLHVVSHGPHCLDGVAAAVVVARYYEGVEAKPHFATNAQINEVLRSLKPAALPSGTEVWITDISWTDKETDAHLRDLAVRGVKIYWFDHHRTAVERYRSGEVEVPFADLVVREDFAASRLVYEYLQRRLRQERKSHPSFMALHKLVQMADDNDRWLHQIEGSHELALTVRAMATGGDGLAAYRALLHIDAEVSYTPEMREAYKRAMQEIRASLELAEQSRTALTLPEADLTVVAALCDGYPSEVAGRWGQKAQKTVFALYDLKGKAVSLRRSPDCRVDLSRVARALGGGGHPAASGCYLPEFHRKMAEELGRLMVQTLASLAALEDGKP